MIASYQKRPWPLFIKLLLYLIPTTLSVWLVISVVGFKFISNRAREEFINTNIKIMQGIAQQSITNINYSDFYQIKRTLSDFFDPKYMDCIAIYSRDMKPLAIYPTSLPGTVLTELENFLSSGAHKSPVSSVYDHRFLFHIDIADEDENPLGCITMLGNTAPIQKNMRTQAIIFAMLGGALLLISIVLLTYFSLRATRPFKRLTASLQAAGDNPDIDDLRTGDPSAVIGKNACKEVSLFYHTYHRLMGQIKEHQKHEKVMAIQASIGNMTSHIAHDIRNPLHTISAFLKMLPPPDDEDLKQLHEAAGRGVGRLSDMADELLDYSKSGRITPVKINLRTLLNNIVKEVSPQAAEKGIAVDLACPEDIAADLDAQKINRVFVNIIVNAMQAISIPDGRIPIVARKSGDVLVISVADNGSGIAEEHIPHLFDSSFTYGKRRGTGLGLSYCQKVVESHGGSISVESRAGKGSIFTVMLPIRQKGREAAAVKEVGLAATKAPRRPRKETPVILVVDDDPNIRFYWKTIFKKRQITPIEADSMEDLLSQDIDYGKIDIAIVDYQFEGSKWNGLDVIRHLSKNKVKNLFLCTGLYQDEGIRFKAEQMGVHAIIPKPFTEEVLDQIM